MFAADTQATSSLRLHCHRSQLKLYKYDSHSTVMSSNCNREQFSRLIKSCTNKVYKTIQQKAVPLCEIKYSCQVGHVAYLHNNRISTRNVTKQQEKIVK